MCRTDRVAQRTRLKGLARTRGVEPDPWVAPGAPEGGFPPPVLQAAPRLDPARELGIDAREAAQRQSRSRYDQAVVGQGPKTGPERREPEDLPSGSLGLAAL